MRIPSFRTAVTALALALLSVATAPHDALATSQVVISQVYGGGGNSGATFKNDFIELHNRGNAAVSLTGWTVQYASATGSTWATTSLTGSIPAGGYYLVHEAAGTGGIVGPAPDATGIIAMSATAGKVALVSNATALAGTCPTGGAIIDFVGYGVTANCSEGSPTANLTNTTAALRGNLGCTDTDANSLDFATGTAAPRNSSTAAYQCEFTLTYNAGPNGSISGITPQTVPNGGSGSAVTAVPDAGYHFVSWSDGVLTASRTDGPITADLTVSASFAINEYTLTYNAGPNGSISGITPQTVPNGGSGSAVTAVPDAGYHFVSWSDGVLTASRTDGPITADLTVSASFAINEYTLTYNAGPNGSISGTTPQTVAHGGSGSAVTAVPDAGYHFVSWSDGVLTASRTDGPITADLTVSASFAINEYTLTYNAGPNGSISGTTPQTVAHGGSGSAVTAVPDAGYHFVSWSDGVLTASRTDGPITADLTVSASFAINEYTLTYNAGPNGSISGTTPQTVAHGGSGSAVTAVPDAGYHFVSWSDGVLTASRTDGPITADLTVTASFAINSYTLTYLAGPNGSISGSTPQAVAHGGSGTAVTAVPDAGYHFVSWSDGVLTASRTDGPITADLTVSASFAINEYTLTYNAGPNGSISGTTPQTVAHGGSGSAVTAVPDAGYYFVSWSDGVLTASRTDTNVMADLTVTASFDVNPVIVISQVYGGGGNSGAPLKNDYIELYNRGPSTVNLAGWTVQYASATGSTWQTTPLTGSIVSGGYYLVQEAAGAGVAPPLPTPDAIGTIAMNATAGKVAVVNGTLALTGTCPSGPEILDLVGYGAANCSEGSPTPAISNTTADFRKGNGCTDTNDNLADFLIAAPAPRNSASPINNCSGVLTVVIDSPGMGTVAVSPDQPSYPNGTPVQLTATPNAVDGFHFVSWGGDATGSSNPLNLIMNGDRTVIAHFAPNTPVGRIVISQVYGGGGNGAAPFKNDYVELYNRGSLAVDITGWSLQYASATGGTWSTTNLIGTIQPGRYYLIQQQAGVGTGAALPAPDAIGVINLSASTGKVALVNSGVVLVGNCPSGSNIIDMLGYGGADCSEGSSPAIAADNSTAEFRNSDGCDDSDVNSADFSLNSPAPRNSATAAHICSEWLAVDDGITSFTLGNAIPNPVRGHARIPFALPRESDVRIEVIDIQGRIAATLVEGRRPAGRHEVKWDGVGSAGALPPGMYLVRMRVAGTMLVRRVTLMR